MSNPFRRLRQKAKSRKSALSVIALLCALGFVIIIADIPGRLKEFQLLRDGKADVHTAYQSEERSINEQLLALLGAKSQYNSAYCEHSGGTETREKGYCMEIISYDASMNLTQADASNIISDFDKFFFNLGWGATDIPNLTRHVDGKVTINYLGYTKRYPHDVTCWVNGSLGVGLPQSNAAYYCSKELDLGKR